MKVRNGFVSNSSSSSFILNFDGEITKDKVKDFLRQFGMFEDLDYSAECFMNEAKLLKEEDIDRDIKYYKNESWASDLLEDANDEKELFKKYPKGLYKICISDHRDEDPWAIMNVCRKNGEIIDYDCLECRMQWGADEIVKWENGH